MRKIKISIEDEDGGASVLVNEHDGITKWIEAIVRLLMYAGWGTKTISEYINHE